MNVLFKKYLIYILAIIIVIGAGLYFTIPMGQQYFTKSAEIKSKQETIDDLNKSIELAKKNQIEAMSSEQKEDKQIYEPEIKSTDMMVNFNGMLETVLNLAKEAGIKTRTIEFKTIPESDPIKQNHSGTHDATLLQAQMIKVLRYFYFVKFPLVPCRKSYQFLCFCSLKSLRDMHKPPFLLVRKELMISDFFYPRLFLSIKNLYQNCILLFRFLLYLSAPEWNRRQNLRL